MTTLLFWIIMLLVGKATLSAWSHDQDDHQKDK